MLAVCAPAPVTRSSGSASGTCFAGSHSPWSPPFAPPTPRRIAPLCSPASQLLWQGPTSRVRSSSATAPHLPDAGRQRQHRSGQTRDLPASDAILLHVMWPLTPAGRQHLALTVPHMLPSSNRKPSAPAMSDLSWLNPTPHAIAVYASQPLSPVATQHSLPSGRYSLLGPDLHRLDRTSFAWRIHSITSSARASSVGQVMTSNGLRLRDLFKNASFGLDANCDKGDGRDQIGESECIKGPAAEPVSKHKADHGGCQERADAPDPEEPADSRGPQMGRVQFADVDPGSAVYAGVDPADQEGRDISDKTRRHRKRQMEESAHKIVQEQNRAAAIAIDQKTATRKAEEASDRLDQLESNGVRQWYPALRQDCGQHEQNAV